MPTIALDLSEEQLRLDHPLARLSEVASDSHGAARMAAEHLLERGLRHYAFVGVPGRVWSDRRQEGFCAEFARRVMNLTSTSRPGARAIASGSASSPPWRAGSAQLPRPVGLMACNDDRGREVLEACRAGGLRVPEEMAVVGRRQ